MLVNNIMINYLHLYNNLVVHSFIHSNMDPQTVLILGLLQEWWYHPTLEELRWSCHWKSELKGNSNRLWDSLVAQMEKRLPAMRETQVRSLGQEDPLEKEMATHSSTLAYKIPWMEEPGGLHGVTKSRTRLSDFTHSNRSWKVLR